MRLLIITMIFALTLPGSAVAQQVKFEGTHPPDSAVLKLLDDYATIFDKYRNVAERDAKRKTILSTGYFYHGVDGAAIGLEGLTKRQTKNEFKLIADSVYDQVLYQYENTAILVFKEWQHLVDKGVEKESYGSVLIVMGKENGQWKVISDIIGRKPKDTPAEKIINH